MSLFEDEGLEGLRRLQVELTALEQGSLSNVSRLVDELHARQDEFRSLLDKKGRSDQSLQKLKKGLIHVDNHPISLNEEFQNGALELAHLLDLDEIEAAQLFFHASQETYDRPVLWTALLNYHTRRVFLLDCLRLCTHYASGQFDDDQHVEAIKTFCLSVFTSPSLAQPPQPAQSKFFSRCLDAMEAIETWLESTAARLNTLAVTNQEASIEAELIEMQQDRLVRQHEALAEIITDFERFVKASQEDLQRILAKVKKLRKYDIITLHYMAPLIAMLFQFGRSDQRLTQEDALEIHNQLFSNADRDVWPLRQLQATMRVIWLPSYTSRFLDASPSVSVTSGDPKETEKRTAQFIEALNDGAFHLLLLLCREMKRNEFYEPARHELSDFLLKEHSNIHLDICAVDDRFHRKFLECLQDFVESFISNMPDTIRRLKLEEDDQRRFLKGQLQQGEEKFNLEQFLVIVSYAYEGFPEASAAFWEDSDSNLHGFLVWASQRLSTPRAAAFCDMLITLSAPSREVQGADAAHTFLLAETPHAGGRMRRNSPLSWHHIYSEVEFFASRVRDKLNAYATPSSAATRSDAVNFEEQESTMMLESYLRLMAHLAASSPQARNWLLSMPDSRVTCDLLYLCSGMSNSRLRACGFDAIRALLTAKTHVQADLGWALLDEFIWKKSTIPRPVGLSVLEPEQVFLSSLQDGPELPSAFVSLLTALCIPAYDQEDKNRLPFPEGLGVSYRAPGIEGYVDFVFDRVFCWSTSLELADNTQIKIMRLRCLEFIAECLQSFNENLVVFANMTRVNVDSTIATSNVVAYIKMHPFARVMEWFYNERAIKALFETATQNIEEVDSVSEESPLLLSTLKAVEIISTILALQPTYLNIVKPQLKIRSDVSHRQVVANTALASFDDALLNHMAFISTLGQYCACNHHELNEASLRLMNRLSSSRKLSLPPSVGRGQRVEKSRLLTALERDGLAHTIAQSLARFLAWDEREHEKGPLLPSFRIKLNILRFLNQSLGSSPDRPSVAHLLLGFQCGANALAAPEDMDLESEKLLFGAIVRFLCNCPDGTADLSEDGFWYFSWILELKLEAMQVLQKLWRSPLSAGPTIQALMRCRFAAVQMICQEKLKPQAGWVGYDQQFSRPDAEDFYQYDVAYALAHFLERRSILFEYIATEAREAQVNGSTSILEHIRHTLLGNTTLDDGQQYVHPTLVQLMEELNLGSLDDLPIPESSFFNTADIAACRQVLGHGIEEYASDWVEQLLDLQSQQAQKQTAWTETDKAQLQADRENLEYAVAHNNRVSGVLRARYQYIKSWAQLIMVVLQTCDFDNSSRYLLADQLLQLVLSHFEAAIQSDQGIAAILATLVKSLLSNVSPDALTTGGEAGADLGSGRLFEVFRIALSGIQGVDSTSEIREMCCQICHAIVAKLLANDGALAFRRQAVHTIKECGYRLLTTLAEEALSGSDSARLSAMAVLMAFTVLSAKQASPHVADILSHIGFIQVVVDSLSSIPHELAGVYGGSNASSLPHQEAVLRLLVCLAQTRHGAAQVLNASFFSAVDASAIFSADPDIGLDIENPSAIGVYFRLMLAMLRVINAIVISSGEENGQVIAAAHNFLANYRMPIVSIFKRNARIGSGKNDHEEVLSDLVDNFTVLMTTSGYMEAEPESRTKQARDQRLFT